MGHSASATGHTQAVNSIGLHLFGVCLWLGGLTVIALLGAKLAKSPELSTFISRYSAIALFSFVVVAYSGVVNSMLRVENLDDLMTPYGQVIIAKSFATILLGLIGFWHRRFVIARLGRAASATVEFWRLILVEFVIFGATMGLAVALSRSQPPVSQEPWAIRRPRRSSPASSCRHRRTSPASSPNGPSTPSGSSSPWA